MGVRVANPDEERIKRNRLLHADAVVWVNSYHLSHQDRQPTVPDFCKVWGRVLLDYLLAERKLMLRLASAPGCEPVQEVLPYNGKD
jgi:hypothetical protein